MRQSCCSYWSLKYADHQFRSLFCSCVRCRVVCWWAIFRPRSRRLKGCFLLRTFRRQFWVGFIHIHSQVRLKPGIFQPDTHIHSQVRLKPGIFQPDTLLAEFWLLPILYIPELDDSFLFYSFIQISTHLFECRSKQWSPLFQKFLFLKKKVSGMRSLTTPILEDSPGFSWNSSWRKLLFIPEVPGL